MVEVGQLATRKPNIGRDSDPRATLKRKVYG